MDDVFLFFGRSVPDLAKLLGFILTIFGIAAYIISGQSSITALLPSFMGAPLLLLGILSERMPDARHHLMHASMVLALLMAISPIGMVANEGIPDSSLTIVSLFSCSLESNHSGMPEKQENPQVFDCDQSSG